MRVQPSLRVGHNRTGMAAADDKQRQRMLEIPHELGPTSRGSSDEIARVRVRYARAGMPVGTMPDVPRAQRGLLPLHDLLGARLQFERTGVRLYDALLSKLDAYGGFEGGPDRGDLEQIRDEELAHMRMLEHMLEDTGADPTTITPTADLQSTASRGIADVLLDPRTTLLDGLGVIVIAELADHEEWIGLIELGRELGRSALVHSFQSAQLTEEEHLSKIRSWIHAGRIAARSQLAIH
jgi:rubrerythrin